MRGDSVTTKSQALLYSSHSDGQLKLYSNPSKFQDMIFKVCTSWQTHFITRQKKIKIEIVSFTKRMHNLGKICISESWSHTLQEEKEPPNSSCLITCNKEQTFLYPYWVSQVDYTIPFKKTSCLDPKYHFYLTVNFNGGLIIVLHM